MLEMVGPQGMPEHGVGRYAGDPTQGPACAMAAGAATIYRNYLVPVGDQIGQTESCQLDGFAALDNCLAQSLGCDPQALWTIRNGYALFKPDAVRKMSATVAALDDQRRDALKQLLCIGLHWDVEVTDSAASPGPHVSQAFCSALPISYNQHGHGYWAPFGQRCPGGQLRGHLVGRRHQRPGGTIEDRAVDFGGVEGCLAMSPPGSSRRCSARWMPCRVMAWTWRRSGTVSRGRREGRISKRDKVSLT